MYAIDEDAATSARLGRRFSGSSKPEFDPFGVVIWPASHVIVVVDVTFAVVVDAEDDDDRIDKSTGEVFSAFEEDPSPVSEQWEHRPFETSLSVISSEAHDGQKVVSNSSISEEQKTLFEFCSNIPARQALT